MQKNNQDPEDKFIIPVSDIRRLYRRSKKKIFASAIALGLFGAFWTLTKPVEYRAESTFREKSTKPVNIGNSLSAMLMMGGAGGAADNEAIASIKSRQLMQHVVEKLNLQATVNQQEPTDTYLGRIGNHLKVAYLSYMDPLHPSLKDPFCPLKVDSLLYGGETPLSIKVVLEPDTHYQVFSNGALIGDGQLGTPFIGESFQFTLNCAHQLSSLKSVYNITLWPMAFKADILSKAVKIDADKNDKTLLKLSYQHRDRHLATSLVNTVMKCYQDFLKQHSERQASLQLAYLKKRRAETETDLIALMNDHAKSLSQDLSSTGFADSEKEMAFLAARQHELKSKLLSNELEMIRLQNVQEGKCVYYDQYASSGDPSIINTILNEVRGLKQQRDALELAVRKNPLMDSSTVDSSFNKQLDELSEIQLYIQELHTILNDYQRGQAPDTSSKLFNDPRFLVRAWYEKVNPSSSTDIQTHERQEQEREHFLFYLQNLERMLSVHEKIIQERLTHQQNPSLEFQGIQLDTARELYMSYSKSQHQLEAQIRQNSFLLSQMEDPNFEISSLSLTLKDPVSLDMITKASQLVLALKDANNRSTKEQERLKEDLSLQRNFLSIHLKQMTELLALNQELDQEKVYALQNVMLELIHQQISLLGKNLQEYVSNRLENIKQEGVSIEMHLAEMHKEMAGLPHRRVGEKLIDQNVETNQLIVEEIAKMVESKNIAHKLELIQSAPIDIAVPPLHPSPTNLLFFTLFGSIFGGLLSFGIIVGKSVSKGITVSEGNLKLINQHVSGKLSTPDPQSNQTLSDNDLETLRRLQTYFLQDSHGNTLAGQGHTLLLIEGAGPDYSADLAALLIKKGLKPITISLSFDGTDGSTQTGLLDYLQGTATFPGISHDESGDHIQAGGVSRYSIELLTTARFRELIDKLKTKYDWIIAVTRAMPTSAEAESLLPQFPLVAVSVCEETLPELNLYTKMSDPHRKTTFVMVEEDA